MIRAGVATLGITGLLAWLVVLAVFGRPNSILNLGVEPPRPSLREAPAQPAPLLLHPLPGYVLESEFGKDLLRLAARACEAKGDTSYHIHALRLLEIARRELPGEPAEAYFEDCLSMMLDHRRFERMVSELPILRSTVHGAGYRTHAKARPRGLTASMPGGMTHVDKPLSVFGELGLSLSTAIHTTEGEDLTLADVLEDSLQRYHAGREVEWSFLAYCDYLGSQDQWSNRRGERHSMRDLLARLLNQTPLEGPCLGGHRLYALAKGLASRHQPEPPFTESEYASIRQALQDASVRLTATQRRDGAWDHRWSDSLADDEILPPDGRWDADGLTATSHMLEWFAIADSDCRPAADVMHRAVRYLETRLRSDAEFCFNQDLGPTTHAVRALFHLSESRPRPEE